MWDYRPLAQEKQNADLRAELAAERGARQLERQEQQQAMARMALIMQFRQEQAIAIKIERHGALLREHAAKAEVQRKAEQEQLEKRIESKLAIQAQIAQLERNLTEKINQMQSRPQQIRSHPASNRSSATLVAEQSTLAAEAEAERILQEAHERARERQGK